MGESRRVGFRGPAGTIEGILQGRGDDDAPRLAVVCHPHPLGGGTIHTKVVHRAARALELSGHLVLRFNFRGVGASEGVHDHGRGEQEDVRAALDFLLGLQPHRPVTLAGFSFGSWVGLRVGCTSPAVTALVGIAPPANIFDFGFLAHCPKPKLFIHGTADTLVPLDAFEEIYPLIDEPKRLVRIEGASHLLTEDLDALEAEVRAFGESLGRG